MKIKDILIGNIPTAAPTGKTPGAQEIAIQAFFLIFMHFQRASRRLS
ncbi:hypothetical protein [Gibbsiella quercinecans]|nr:hypothetical protein [Gibbsiella quercinecans]